jgi:hypothetical protein
LSSSCNRSTTRLDFAGQPTWSPSVPADLTQIAGNALVRGALLARVPTDRTAGELVAACRRAVEDPKLRQLRERLADLEARLIPAAWRAREATRLAAQQANADAEAAARVHADLVAERTSIRATLGVS